MSNILESIDKIGERVHRVLIPLVHGKGNWKNMKIDAHFEYTGWYWVELGEKENDVRLSIIKASPLEARQYLKQERRLELGYTFNNEFIPFSFGVFRNKYFAYESSFPLYFYSKPWNVIISHFRNKEMYFVDWAAPTKQLIDVRDRFEHRQNLEGLKGITPELRHLFFLHCLERSTQEELEKAKKEEEFKKTLMGRIKSAIEEAGGYLERIYQRGENVEIVWKIGDEQFNSIVRATNLRVKEAGYCLSGGDERLSLKAAVLTAQDYIEKDLIYKTRY